MSGPRYIAHPDPGGGFVLWDNHSAAVIPAHTLAGVQPYSTLEDADKAAERLNAAYERVRE